jgi:hypothetical protein
VKDGHLDDELHLAEMVSLMGPPPQEFLSRSEECRRYWDAEGKLYFNTHRLLHFLSLSLLFTALASPADQRAYCFRELVRGDAHPGSVA